MNAQQKAQDLITTNRFLLSIPGAPLGDQKDEIAKQCALNTVNEIMEELVELPQHLYVDRQRYWNEVKKEVEAW